MIVLGCLIVSEKSQVEESLGSGCKESLSQTTIILVYNSLFLNLYLIFAKDFKVRLPTLPPF